MTTEEIALQVAKKWQMVVAGVEWDFAIEVAKRAVEAEREACAEICDTKGATKYAGLTIGEQCAVAIRKRSNANVTGLAPEERKTK